MDMDLNRLGSRVNKDPQGAGNCSECSMHQVAPVSDAYGAYGLHSGGVEDPKDLRHMRCPGFYSLQATS